MELPKIIHESWHSYLQPLFDDPKMVMLKERVIPATKFYPESKDIFRVFSMPLDKIKVVCLGQDPYSKGEAIGLAFAVNKRTPWPKSLNIIHKEAGEPAAYFKDPDDWKTLEHWTQQGVFLLNTALTVAAGTPGSHTNQWQWFTREVVRVISEQVKPIWLLWGGKAQAFESHIYHKLAIDKNVGSELPTWIIDKHNIVLKAPHPAAETYPDSKSKEKFTGCNHFTIVNQILKLKGLTPIKW